MSSYRSGQGTHVLRPFFHHRFIPEPHTMPFHCCFCFESFHHHCHTALPLSILSLKMVSSERQLFWACPSVSKAKTGTREVLFDGWWDVASRLPQGSPTTCCFDFLRHHHIWRESTCRHVWGTWWKRLTMMPIKRLVLWVIFKKEAGNNLMLSAVISNHPSLLWIDKW